MTIPFPDKACAGTCTWKSIFIAEPTIQKQQKVLQGICYGITPTLNTSADYREKQSHNCMMYSHLA